MNSSPGNLAADARANRAGNAPLGGPPAFVTRRHTVWEGNRPNATMRDSLRNAAHVWCADLDHPSKTAAELLKVLSPDERERTARFRFDVHRERFVAGRAFLRDVLSSYFGIEPVQISFAYGPNGKPSLSPGLEESGVHFNLSHSESMALLALTQTGAMGVDVERIRPLKDAGDLVARFFSGRENALFQQLAEEEKPVAFFNLWTRKEAWLKATGEGLSELLNQVEVSFLPEEPAQLLSLPAGFDVQTWSLNQVNPAPEYVGALALSARNCAIQCWSYASP